MTRRPPTFDLEALRSFVTGIELGNFAHAAQRLGRSTSAVSAQLKKLEQQAGRDLVEKTGRHLRLTESGEVMLSYARRILSLNDEAYLSMHISPLSGQLHLGMQEDFGEALLPAILGEFTRSHPQVQISASVTRNQPLLDGISNNEFDLALCWQWGEMAANSRSLGRLPLQWIGAADCDIHRYIDANIPLPLLVFETPCIMRKIATTALDRAGIAWRIAFSSRSLSGIWAAITAGLGITVRTTIGVPQAMRIISAPELPPLGDIGISLYQSNNAPDDANLRLQETIALEVSRHL
ncbi:LysR substrate-binding domain-containing protein [Rouxiella sp. Mn2063]|uniref:LysR substrate-binding domain-containing protein n=1 Tax=Rouxiella sp. Mn2063 TaxID=3395262 RepID=UPI003BE5D832